MVPNYSSYSYSIVCLKYVSMGFFVNHEGLPGKPSNPEKRHQKAKVAHNPLKIAHNHRPLAFQAHVRHTYVPCISRYERQNKSLSDQLKEANRRARAPGAEGESGGVGRFEGRFGLCYVYAYVDSI